MNNVWRRTMQASSVVGIAGGLLFLAGHHPADVAAQGGSIPLRGGVQQVHQDQDAWPQLFAAPSGEIFRVWSRLPINDREGGGAVLLASAPDGLAWRPLTQLRPEGTGVSTLDGRLAMNPSGEIALAYRWVRFNPKAKHIRVARSSDRGETWTFRSDNVDLNGQAFDPQVAWGPGKTMVVAWADERQQARTFQIYLRRSPDGGSTWESELLMSGHTSAGDYHTAPRLLADGQGRFWLLWIAVRNRRAVLTLVRSEDAGRTWLPPQHISGDSYSVYGHSVTLAGSRLLVTWEDQKPDRPNRVYATASKDGGVTWSPASEADGLAVDAPTIAAGPSNALATSGEAWVAWHDSRNGRLDVFIARSADGGVTWGSALRLDADGPGTAISRYPKMAMSVNGSVAVVWEDDRRGFEAVYGRIFSGGRWNAESLLGQTLPPKKAGRAPRVIATRQDAFYVVWEIWDYTRGGAPMKSLDSTLVRVPPAPGS